MEELMEILQGICPGVDFETETALVDDGILESLDMVSLVGELMDTFDIELSVDDLLPENFNSAEAIWTLIQRKRD